MFSYSGFFYVIDGDATLEEEFEVIDNMIISLVRYYHWTPDYIESLCLDDVGIHSLEFWYNDLKKIFKPKEKE
mgnify:CR=1 FL=1